MENFYEPYRKMPEVIGLMEESGLIDEVEVYKRGEKPLTLERIYTNKEKGRYRNSKEAVLEERKIDRRKTIQNPEEIKLIKKVIQEDMKGISKDTQVGKETGEEEVKTRLKNKMTIEEQAIVKKILDIFEEEKENNKEIIDLVENFTR